MKALYNLSIINVSTVGVWWRCPLIGDEAFERTEIEQRIETFLLSQLGEEPAMTSALMIHTLNKVYFKIFKSC